MKRHYLNIFLAAWVVLSSAALYADTYDTMRERLFNQVALGSNFDTSDADVTTYVTAMDNNTQTYWSSMEKSPAAKGYLWSTYNKLTGDETNTPSHVWHTYGNLREMAKSYACPVSTYYHNASLLSDIKLGLDYLNTVAFNTSTEPIGDFYAWRIGIPEYYGHIVTLLYDELTDTQKGNYDASVGHMICDLAVNGNMTYANQANVCQELITLGILTKKSADIQSALTNAVRVFVDETSTSQRNTAQTQYENCWKAQGDYHDFGGVGSKKEGYWPDGTFIQHISIPYIGHYGMEMIELSSFMARILAGTDFTVPAAIQAALPGLIKKTYLPAIYKGEIMHMFMGRGITTSAFQNAGHILLDSYCSAKEYISDASDKAQVIALCKQSMRTPTYSVNYGGLSPLKDKPVYNALQAEAAASETSENYSIFYPCGDRLIFHTDKFRFGLSMSSARIGKFESINDMNTTGWYMGDGMTYLYMQHDRNQYTGYFSNKLNWYRLPGTTVDVVNRAEETNNYGLFGTPANQKDWVGGLAFRGRYAQAGMQLQGQVSSLNAKKSWFCFTDEIVCLGAGISMTEQRNAETIIENRKSTRTMYIEDQARATTKDAELIHTNPSYMYLEGTGGYYFPDANQTVCSYVSSGGYSMIYFNHGQKPANATYAYVLLPAKTRNETVNYASSKPVRVLRNDADIQAVLHTPTGVEGINFWTAGSINGVTSDGAASVMLQQSGQDLYIAISEPTWKRASQTITLDGVFTLESSSVEDIVSLHSDATTTTIVINTTNRWGQSVELKLKDTTPRTTHYIKRLTGMYDYVGDSVASVNVDFTTWSATDLEDPAVGSDYVSGPHTLAFTEKENMGFQKWVIYPNRWLVTGINKNALFNNAKNNAETDSLDQPVVYFPAVKGGIKRISVTGRQGGRPLIVLGYRESSSAWEKIGTLTIANAYDTYTFDVNSADICRIALYGQKANTAYTSITHINISSMNEEEKPEETALYVLNPITGIYAYHGEPVNDIDIDFANWDPTDLPSTFTDDMALTEVQDYGFVKWKIQAYKNGVVDQNVLFNNNASDFGGSPTNNTTSNPPAIYFPTTVRGVKSIAITYVIGANPAWLNYTCIDSKGSTTQNVQLPASTAENPQTYTLNLNTEGQTTVYFLYKVTAWPRIMSIKFALEEETPTAIDNVPSENVSCTKELRNGQIVIIKNGIRYNILGCKL